MNTIPTLPDASLRRAGTKLVKTPLSEQAYEELKGQILDQQLTPGQRLNIDALSRSCGISSSPLREALARLVAEGLVVFTANAGFTVAPVPDPVRMRQLMEFRLVMEAYCVRVGAAAGDPAIVAALSKAIEDMAALRADGGLSYRHYRSFIALEQRFHETLIASGNNPVIAEAWRNLHLIINVARLSVVPHSDSLGSDAAVLEHRAILDAYVRQDAEAAEHAIKDHLTQAIAR